MSDAELEGAKARGLAKERWVLRTHRGAQCTAAGTAQRTAERQVTVTNQHREDPAAALPVQVAVSHSGHSPVYSWLLLKHVDDSVF